MERICHHDDAIKTDLARHKTSSSCPVPPPTAASVSLRLVCCSKSFLNRFLDGIKMGAKGGFNVEDLLLDHGAEHYCCVQE